MHEDFDGWNEIKKNINHIKKEIYFYEREIWWISLGTNIGFEQDGKNENFTRPVLIIRKFSKNVFIGVPLTSSTKVGRYRISFTFLDSTSTALISQVRLFDAKRLFRKIGKLEIVLFHSIRQAVKDIL